MLLESRVNAFEQNPISSELYSAAISQTSHLREVASADSDCAEVFEIAIPLGIIPRQPGFDDPRFATDDRAGQTAKRLHTILNVNNGANPDSPNLLVSNCRRTIECESLSSILTDHGEMDSHTQDITRS
jgi:hypothetical protein